MIKNGKLYYSDKLEKEVKIGKSCYVANLDKVYYYKAITSITLTDNTFAIATASGDTKCFHYDDLNRNAITYSHYKDGKIFNILNTSCKVFASKDEAFEFARLGF